VFYPHFYLLTSINTCYILVNKSRTLYCTLFVDLSDFGIIHFNVRGRKVDEGENFQPEKRDKREEKRK